MRRDNRWLVPAEFLPRALSSAINTRLDLRRAMRLLIVGEMRVPRIVARVDAGSTNVAVTFEVTPNTEARVTAQPGRLVVQFEADALELSVPLIPHADVPHRRSRRATRRRPWSSASDRAPRCIA